MTNNNPLLIKSTAPNQAPLFGDIKTEYYLPAFTAAIEEARANIDAIKANTDAPTFENTIVALETASETLSSVGSVFYNQLAAMGGDDLHALTSEIGPMNAAFSSDVNLDADLFARIKAVHDIKDTLDLTEEQATLLDDTYKGFVRSGALLDDDKKSRLREISQELSTLGPAFMQNVSKSAESFEMLLTGDDEIAGLPESALEAAKHAASERDQEGYLFTLDYPSFGPFLQFADNRALREKIWRAFSSRAFEDEYDNCDNIKKIVSLKDERAKLLGFKNHADYVLAERMAGSPKAVTDFLDTLLSAYKPGAEKDLQDLQDFAKGYDGSDDLRPWDFSYYSEKLKKKLFSISSEDFRPYLPLSTVLGGCFTHFEKLFNIRFEENNAYPKWHADVQSFDVFYKDSGDFVGTLYADFHPRSGKKPGAWKTCYRNQGLFGGKVERPVVAIVCNFTKPTADRPSLLTHGEVTTLFHEMGHAVHALLSDVTYQSLAGTSVKWDFVELPSQLQENWCFEKETLDMISGHYQTGEKIPQDLIARLNNAKNFMGGWAGLRQVSFGLLDIAWHTTDPSTIDDPAAFEDETWKDVTLFPRYAGPMSTSFNHIFSGGYSAGYYSYKWAEVLDADAFEAFLENGLYDQKTANAYKNEVLSQGGTKPPQILYVNFRGRDADPDALLRREGLK
ncbi:MAG: peptidase M3 [Alphaproteobacteria bacterium]|nr:peptidase M3 [Alphaproteobacteria bacterium]